MLAGALDELDRSGRAVALRDRERQRQVRIAELHGLDDAVKMDALVDVVDRDGMMRGRRQCRGRERDEQAPSLAHGAIR
jgi:hypothetical protein